MIELSDIHNCEESEGKIVCISIDLLGNTYCRYCGQQVRYPKMNEEDFEKLKKQIRIIENG